MCSFWFPGVGLVGGLVLFTACVNLMYVGEPAVMVSAILAARHRTFVLVVISLFVLFFFLCTINLFFFFDQCHYVVRAYRRRSAGKIGPFLSSLSRSLKIIDSDTESPIDRIPVTCC